MFFRPKTAKENYNESMLPQNRKEVYFDVLKLHFGKLLLCGVCLLVFSFLLHFTAVGKDLYQLSILESYHNSTMKLEDAYNALKTLKVFTSLINILGYLILAVGLSGLARIIKRYAWEEQVYIGNDFIKGVKQNSIQYILLSLFVGVLVLACSYVTDPLTVGNGPILYIGIIGTILCGILLIPIAAYMAVTISIYGIRFTQNIRFALILYMKNFFKTILACVICLSPYFLQIVLELLLPQYLIVTILMRALTSLLIPFVFLGWMLFSLNCLDRTINKDNFPELVNKGIFIPQNKEAENKLKEQEM